MSEQTYTVPQLRQRLRLTYEKGEAIKFISHQDEFRLWERTLRRAELPLLYTQGFNPGPQMQFAAPLGVGITGAQEFIDIFLSPPVDLAAVAQLVRAKLPPGVTLHAWQELPLDAPSLQPLLIGADYTILIYAEPDELPADLLPQRIGEFWQKTEFWRERERKGEKYTYNLRPLVFELVYEGYNAALEAHAIFLRVQQRHGATGRPDEVVAALGLDDFPRTLRRDRLYFSDDPIALMVFDAYPLITQAEISPKTAAKPRPTSRRKAHHHKSPHKTGRSINERAADEFV